jgi:hypothetical protein
MAESPEKGRKTLTERDRAADVGESVDEYRRGDWTTEGDPADRARQEAVEENRRPLPGDRAPGTASLDQPSRRKKPSRPDDEPMSQSSG